MNNRLMLVVAVTPIVPALWELAGRVHPHGPALGPHLHQSRRPAWAAAEDTPPWDRIEGETGRPQLPRASAERQCHGRPGGQPGERRGQVQHDPPGRDGDAGPELQQALVEFLNPVLHVASVAVEAKEVNT